MGVFKAIGVGVALLLSPIGLVVAAVAGLVAALANLVLRWDKIKKGFGKGIWQGTKTFFGFGDDDKANGDDVVKSNSAAKGKPLGANKIIQQTNEMRLREQKANIGVNFANAPKGTTIVSEDKHSMLNITSTGAMGAI